MAAGAKIFVTLFRFRNQDLKVSSDRTLWSKPHLMDERIGRLVKFLRRMTSGGRLEAWHFR